MATKTTVIVKLGVEGVHCFPKAAELFPKVAFLADEHRHIFYVTAAKKVNHDDRDVEFILFKRDIANYLHHTYYSEAKGLLQFHSKSCEMIAKELLVKFECEWVEVWEDNENGARVEWEKR
jgi:hypothetical protein